MKKPICIYHGNCADGFGAAWAVWHRHRDWEFYPGVHQDEPPHVGGRDVFLVDFSYKRQVLEDMAAEANSVTIIDHHKTAEADLLEMLEDGVIHGIFDMNKSGAMLAWEWFHPGEPPPRLIEHIQDRDLWRFDLPKTREIQAAVFSYPYEFDVWNRLMIHADLNELAVEGAAIERKHHKDVAELVSVTTRMFDIGGHTVPVVNLPYTLTSDAGHLLATGKPFAGCYWDTPDGRVFSLRSTDEGLDVSEIAKQYGGGGHRNASGFRVPFNHPLAA